MRTVVSHFWIHGTNGKRTLYEVDYSVYPIRLGVLCYAKVHHSERPCTCQERESPERQLVAALN
jgi:hypothetical protein